MKKMMRTGFLFSAAGVNGGEPAVIACCKGAVRCQRSGRKCGGDNERSSQTPKGNRKFGMFQECGQQGHGTD